MTLREWLVLRAWAAWSSGRDTLPKKLFDEMLLAGLDPEKEKRHYDIYNQD